ncbi:MAG: LegC family aminotransferase [Lachnospiraceae bacterium]|nr:LegC family aminotransferase [Lachnospiraceae bacterium]
MSNRSEFIPLSIPNLSGNELQYVTEAITTGWVSTAGKYVNEFEKKLSEYVGIEGAVSCQNGTAGLHIALMLCDIKQGDEVIVPTLTFIAAVNPVKYIGAEPVFMDCDDSLCIDWKKIKNFCENECIFENNVLINKKSKRTIKAIVVVHVFGNMADMSKIMIIARKYNLKVVEDATEALGTYYLEGEFKGRYAGTIGTVGVYSFNGNKIITTGGGGMIVSNEKNLLEKAKHLTTQAKSDEINYLHDEVGYNYRMTNIQAAIGLAQLEKLEEFIKIKNDNYNYYKENFSALSDVELLDVRGDIRSNRWFYALKINDFEKKTRDHVIKYLAEKKIQTRPIWGLISEQKPYLNCQTFDIKKAKYYREKVINIPCSTNLLEDDKTYVVDSIRKCMEMKKANDI